MSDSFAIETPRLTLRVFDDDDLDGLEAVHGDPRVMRFSVGGPKTREQIACFIRNMQHRHGIAVGIYALRRGRSTRNRDEEN